MTQTYFVNPTTSLGLLTCFYCVMFTSVIRCVQLKTSLFMASRVEVPPMTIEVSSIIDHNLDVIIGFVVCEFQ